MGVKRGSGAHVLPAQTFHKSKKSYVEKLTGTNTIRPYAKNPVEVRHQGTYSGLGAGQNSSRGVVVRKELAPVTRSGGPLYT